MKGYIQKFKGPFRESMVNIPRDGRTQAWAFMDLALMRCNWKNGPGGLKRGQFLFGRVEMSEELGMSEQSFRTALELLKELGEIAVKAGRRGSVGTVCHFDTYVAEVVDGTRSLPPSATNQPPADHHSEEQYTDRHKNNNCPASKTDDLQALEVENGLMEEGARLLTFVDGQNLLMEAEDLGYNPNPRKNYRTLCRFVTENGLEGFELAIKRVQERGTIKKDRGPLLAGIIKHGLYDNEEGRLLWWDEE